MSLSISVTCYTPFWFVGAITGLGSLWSKIAPSPLPRWQHPIDSSMPSSNVPLPSLGSQAVSSTDDGSLLENSVAGRAVHGYRR